jgi:hypothetical protein
LAPSSASSIASIVQLAYLPDACVRRHGERGPVGRHRLPGAFAGSLGVFGRVCDMFGRKLLYLGGFALFTGASLLCGPSG